MSGNEITTAVKNEPSALESHVDSEEDISAKKIEGDFFDQDNSPLIAKTDHEELEEEELQNEENDLLDINTDNTELTELETLSIHDQQLPEDIKKPNKITFQDENSKRGTFARSIQIGSAARLSFGVLFKRFSADVTDSFMVSEPKVVLEYPEEKEEEEKHEEECVQEYSIDIIDRLLYYRKHTELTKQKTFLVIENTLLQRRIANYYKKRNLDFVLQEVEPTFNHKERYNNRLKEYDNIIKESSTKKRNIKKQIDLLKSSKEEREKLLIEQFEMFQNKLKDVGQGLIYSKTGTDISEKLIQHFLNRHKMAMSKLSDMSLKFIKLKTMVAEKDAAIQSLDVIDKSHHLSHYEKLTGDHKLHCDKIEEKEVELSKLRMRFTDTVQVIAHLREKISALENDKLDLEETLHSVDKTFTLTRTEVSLVKKKRDMYRALLTRSRENSGLLTQQELLKDMQHSKEEVKSLYPILENLKADCNIKKKQIQRIRKLIENFKNSTETTVKKNIKPRKTSLPTVPKKKNPTIFTPVISSSALDYLEQDFQPTVTRIFSNKKNSAIRYSY